MGKLFISRTEVRYIQDRLARAGYIAGITVIHKSALYIYNTYCNLGVIMPDYCKDVDAVLDTYIKKCNEEIGYANYMDNRDVYNYYMWCKIMHHRKDWQTKYPDYYKRWIAWKLPRLFDDPEYNKQDNN